ncbi:MAG TPA: homocysteine S-methyltransferase family protein [Burkholderiales bacterium]|nr:homocysteine S-methyltransferase family protein [Burkholderiales bacterium]
MSKYRKLRAWLPRLSVIGGCCGTHHRHVEAVCDACLAESGPGLHANEY